MQISVHFVGPPAADEAYAVTVNASAEEGHSAAGPGGPHGYISFGVCGVGVEPEGGSDAKGKVRRGNVTKRKRVAAINGVERGVGAGAVPADVTDAAGKAMNGAEVRVPGAAVTDGFVSNAVLLCSKSESGKRGGKEIGVGARQGIESPGAYPKLDVLETEQCWPPRGAPRYSPGRRRK